jgi:sugar-specific transcriptional regulator TrmB
MDVTVLTKPDNIFTMKTMITEKEREIELLKKETASEVAALKRQLDSCRCPQMRKYQCYCRKK